MDIARLRDPVVPSRGDLQRQCPNTCVPQPALAGQVTGEQGKRVELREASLVRGSGDISFVAPRVPVAVSPVMVEGELLWPESPAAGAEQVCDSGMQVSWPHSLPSAAAWCPPPTHPAVTPAARVGGTQQQRSSPGAPVVVSSCHSPRSPQVHMRDTELRTGCHLLGSWATCWKARNRPQAACPSAPPLPGQREPQLEGRARAPQVTSSLAPRPHRGPTAHPTDRDWGGSSLTRSEAVDRSHPVVPSPATAGAGPGPGRPLGKHFPAAQTSLCHPRGRAAQNGAVNPEHCPPTPPPVSTISNTQNPTSST